MIKYLIRGFYFCIPILLCFIFIFIIDPHEYINVSKVIDADTKIAIIHRCDESSPRGDMLWKYLHFKREPVKKVIIGDSQGRKIKPELIEEISGEKIFNFCVPGASYETYFDIFWFVADQTKLEDVYFQISFMNYNSNRSYNLFHFADDYIQKPYLYFVTKEILFDSFYNLLYVVTKDEKIVQNSYEYAPVEEMDKLARKNLEMFFGDYSYPVAYYSELNKIKQYCDENNIELSFILMPTYKGVAEYLEEHGLTEMRQRFEEEIGFLGDTYNFDVPGEVSNTRENFIDYFHPRRPILDDVTRKVWGKE